MLFLTSRRAVHGEAVSLMDMSAAPSPSTHNGLSKKVTARSTGRGTAPPAIRFSLGLHLGGALALVLHPGIWPWVIAALLGNHAGLALLALLPRSRLLGPNLIRLPVAAVRRGEVAVTFDDGPDPVVTPQVLDLLDRYGAKASFFCIGAKAAAHPEIVCEIVRRGHSVENHSHRHPYAFACYTPGGLAREIGAAQAAIETAAGRQATFFRAPMGFRSPLLHAVIIGAGLRYVSWTRRGFDAVHRQPVEVSRRLLKKLAAGDILLLHDGSSALTAAGQPVVLAVLPRLLERLAAQGLRSVSLPMAFADESIL